MGPHALLFVSTFTNIFCDASVRARRQCKSYVSMTGLLRVGTEYPDYTATPEFFFFFFKFLTFRPSCSYVPVLFILLFAHRLIAQITAYGTDSPYYYTIIFFHIPCDNTDNKIWSPLIIESFLVGPIDLFWLADKCRESGEP